MKAIILAAGRGRRLFPFTDEKPKCLLEIAGKAIIDWQMRAFKNCGITEIAVVKGYRGEMIVREGTREYWNLEYDSSNMVASLFCAEAELHDDLIVAYADILFERRLLQALIEAPADENISIPVDIEWQDYYMRRFGSLSEDAESLRFDGSGCLLNIGDEYPDLSNIQGRFIGLLRLSGSGAREFIRLFHEEWSRSWNNPWIRGRSLKMAFMTDFLQALIDRGVRVSVVPVRRGWIELDSAEDYIKLRQWHEDGSLGELFSFDA